MSIDGAFAVLDVRTISLREIITAFMHRKEAAGVEADPDARELAADDLARMRPFSQTIQGRRRVGAMITAHRVSVMVRLDSENVDFFPNKRSRLAESYERCAGRICQAPSAEISRASRLQAFGSLGAHYSHPAARGRYARFCILIRIHAQ